MKSVREIDHLSYSSVSMYLMCPKSWWFRYIEEQIVPVSSTLKFGTAVHNTIQDGLRQKAEHGNTLTPEGYQRVFETHFNPVAEDQTVNWLGGSFEELSSTAKNIFADKVIVNEINQLDPLVDPDQGIAIEWKVELQVPGVDVPVIGYIDLITSDGVPVDFKTASKKWYQGKADDDLQPTFYLASLSQQRQLPLKEGLFRYVIVTKSKTPTIQTIETYRSPGDLFFMLDVVKSVWKAIQSGSFPENPLTWKCSESWCEYWQWCRGKF